MRRLLVLIPLAMAQVVTSFGACVGQPPPMKSEAPQVREQEREREKQQSLARAAAEEARLVSLPRSEWGRLGIVSLRCSLPERAGMADIFAGRVEVAWSAGDLPDAVLVSPYNPERRWLPQRRDCEHGGTLVLRNRETGSEYSAYAEDPWSGMPPSNDDDQREMNPAEPGAWSWRSTWRAARTKGLAPGDYDACVELQLGSATLRSGWLPIRLAPAETTSFTIYVPKAEQLADGRWLCPDPTVLEPVRVAQTVGFLAGVALPNSLTGTGLPTKENQYAYASAYAEIGFHGVRDRITPASSAVIMTIFESCETTMHFWMPQNCGYRVLFARTYVLTDAPAPP